MSDVNGKGESRLDRMEEILDRLEASHVKLMTDHEVAWAQHLKFVEQQDREWERQKESWKENEAAHQRFLVADVALGKRVDDLVSGIGALIRRIGEGGGGEV
jgi:hypothetical protein